MVFQHNRGQNRKIFKRGTRKYTRSTKDSDDGQTFLFILL